MMHYTVCLLLCDSTQEVLLCKKDRTDFAGRYNGVGGKFNSGETPEECAIREIHEETGANVAGRIRLLGRSWLPQDCAMHDPEGCVLHFFSANVEKNEVCQQPGETEPLEWFSTEEVLNTPVMSNKFAGPGHIQSYLRIAICGYT